MNYEKMWRTLKAESGYRTTKNFIQLDSESIKELMETMEERAKNE